MKEILIIAGRKPYPLDDGWRIRTYHLVKALAESGAEVDLLTFDETGDDLGCGELDTLCRHVQSVPRSKSYSALNLGKGILFSTPFTVLNYYEDVFAEAFAARMREHDYDYIQVEDINMAQYALPYTGAKRVLDMHNIESELLRRYAENASSALRGMYARLTADKLEKYEMAVAAQFDSVLVCSEDEKVELGRKGLVTPVHVIPNGVDCSYYEGLGKGSEEALVFVGSMDYHANISGIRFLATEVLPLLRSEHPGIKIYVVGKNPPDSIRELGDENLIVTGGVPDVRPYLEKGAISIVPLLVGGGTRLKILEAMAAGLPVVSTSLGAEGLQVEHGNNILIADTAEDFARCADRLLGDSAERATIAGQGTLFAKENYDWEVVASKLKPIMVALTGGSAENG